MKTKEKLGNLTQGRMQSANVKQGERNYDTGKTWQYEL